ncbi:SH3 domain-containing protein [Maritalea sp.]|uniref:SH3 domain-containing protein n=1 Tax=Maritalea sp. TaxID=2003361 RepID=UPI003EF1AE81
MDFRKLTKIAALATMGIVITASSAFAFAAKSTAALNIRSGPGTGYDVVDALYKGEEVNVQKCTNSKKWCYIVHSGPDGWVSGKYLAQKGNHKPNKPKKPKHSSNNPKVTFGFQFGSNGSSFSFGLSDNDNDYRPRKARICFYSGAHYSGRKACVAAGSKDNLLSGRWNDRISSIKIIGDAEVKVCKHKNYNGRCRTFDRSVPKLGRRLNNEISSFKSYRY